MMNDYFYYIGQIMMFSGSYTPKGWLPCEGQVLPITEYQYLFAIIGWTYGGDERNTFALPDLRGKMPSDDDNASIKYYIAFEGHFPSRN